MKITLITLTLFFGLLSLSKGQTKSDETSKVPVWTEADRKYLLDNLIRSKEEIIAETKNLITEQWNFKESPERWNINQIVEHIALWEILFMHEISRALATEPNPTFAYDPDSVFLVQDLKGLNAMDYTKPFSFAIPLGNNEGKANVIWLTTMRNESIDYLKKETKNIKLQYDNCGGANVHQYYLAIFSHTDRHLRQIKKAKTHPKYPK
ncbi:MAG: DinB family protein [Chryseolinea sp.]